MLILVGLAAAGCAVAASPVDEVPSDPALGQFAVPIDSLANIDEIADRPLRVVATTTLVADIAGRVGGDHIELMTLLPVGADPHGYSATPQDIRAVLEADVVLANGFDLEASLLADLSQAAPDTPIIALSEGIEALELAEDHQYEEEEVGESEEEHEGDQGHDPHVWFDPLRVDYWAANSARAFIRLDPASEAIYQANASELRQQLVELHAWIYDKTRQVSAEHRELVTDHVALTYFADRYQFENVGAVIPAYSSTAEASAQELAELQELIEDRQVRALFVSATVNPELTQQLAADVGLPVVELYAGSLTPPNGQAADYFAFMEYNVGAIVEALAP